MNWQAKAVIGVVVIAIITGLVFWVRHDSKVITQKTVDNAQQTTVINTQDKTIAQDASSAAITDNATGAAAQIPTQVQSVQTGITNSTDARIAEITKKYAGQTIPTQVTFTPATPVVTNGQSAPKPAPVTQTVTKPATAPSEPTPYEVEVSQARIDGVWQTYCAGNPGDAACQGVPAPQAQ